MANSSSKENILKKIRKALETPVPLPFSRAEGNSPVFHPATDDLTVLFAEEFTRLLGKFAFSLNYEELVNRLETIIRQQQWKDIYCAEEGLKYLLQSKGFNHFTPKSLADSDAALTTCEVMIARTGTIVLSSAQPEGRTASVYSPIHICIAESSQIVYDVDDAIQFLKEKYGIHIPSMISFATGPSRTADIEKTLVVGVHGPKEVYCLLADQ
jgi:L-lactate dehydrogenase complex protein LldG